MTQSDADAARALLGQLMTERVVDEEEVAPQDEATVARPPAWRPLPPPARDHRDDPVPPAPPEGRDYHVAHQIQVCRNCGAELSGDRDWCERCLTAR